MRIQDSKLKHPPFDMPTALGEYLISTGQFSEYTNPAFTASSASVMVFGILQDDLLTPPAITHFCSGCSLKGYTTSEKGTAHKTPIYHCGQQSLPDEATADAYVKAFKAYSRAERPEPKPEAKRVFFVSQGA